MTRTSTATEEPTAEESTTEESTTEEDAEPSGPLYESIEPSAQSMLVRPIGEPMKTTVYRDGSGVLRTGQDGDRTEVGALSRELGRPAVLCTNRKNHWLLVTGSWRERGTAYVYRSAADLTAHRPAAELGGVFPPQRGAVMPFRDRRSGEVGFVWAEYHLASPSAIRVLRAASTPTGGYTIEPVYSLSTADRDSYFHFHSFDIDPYRPNTLYATTGDPNPNPQFYRPRNYGRDWRPVPGAGGTQTFRTLRINFGEEYLYWAMDGWNHGGAEACSFCRAPRSDPSDMEEIGRIGGEKQVTLSYGSARTFDSDGILVTVRTKELRKVPLYFYDLETEAFSEVHEFPTDYDLHHIPGVTATMPYRNRRTKRVSMLPYGVPNSEDYEQFWVELDPRKLV
ncbi:hypothetical protein BRC77_07750 [Halobacteriales archaeon QH_8_64_26]|nr:MAG: hypothetical protein BRC77_07750 [Halobacteriales archaeon QH_8_64_26]